MVSRLAFKKYNWASQGPPQFEVKCTSKLYKSVLWGAKKLKPVHPKKMQRMKILGAVYKMGNALVGHFDSW